MPTWLKVVLIVGGLLAVLVVAGLFGIVYLVKTYGPAVAEGVKQSAEEGRRYGQATDNEGCVNEAVTRHNHAAGCGDLFKEPIFMRACLESSRPTPGFCDGVPSRFEFMKSAQWQLDECKRYGLSPQNQCAQIFQQVQMFCDERGRTSKPAGPEDNDGDSGPPGPPPPAPAPPSSR